MAEKNTEKCRRFCQKQPYLVGKPGGYPNFKVYLQDNSFLEKYLLQKGVYCGYKHVTIAGFKPAKGQKACKSTFFEGIFVPARRKEVDT